MNNEYNISKNIECYDKSIKLDLNEYDFKHPDEFYTMIYDYLKFDKVITHYSNKYNQNTIELVNLISEINDICNNNIILTAGSDNALEYIVNTYVNNNTNVYLFYPTYNYFNFLIKKKNANIIYINITSYDISYNLNDYLLNIKENSIVYIVNPNNPLGIIFDLITLENILNKYKNVLFIIDEAYIEFCYEYSSVNLINKFKNLIIIRTFSKAYGLAGLRLGYIISHYENICEIYKIYNEKSLIEITKKCGIYILKNISHYQNNINIIKYQRDQFQDFLKLNNIFYINSYANFVLFYVGEEYNTFLKILEKNNIYIRDKSSDLYGFLRITIGNPNNMIIVQKIFKENIKLFQKYQ